jgi:hypothetical protein
VGERDWQVGVVAEHTETLRAGYLLLRPWERRHEAFGLADGSADAFSWPEHLFWQRQGYTVAAQFRSSESPPRWRVEFTPVESALGDLRLTGQGLSRVLLTGGQWTVVLDEPSGLCRVPEGIYSRGSVCLAKDGATACRDSSAVAGALRLEVSAGQSAVLAAGGPLTNRVSVNRRGRLLVFNYQLAGAEGATYRLRREDRSRPPEFAVYQGAKEIATGKFEFG